MSIEQANRVTTIVYVLIPPLLQMQLAGERVLYVPPGRRLAAATASTSSISEVSDVKRETKLSSMDSFDSSFSVEEYCSSCLIVEGFTSNTSEIVKDNALQPFRDSGGESVWLGRTKCLLIYKSPSALNGALAGKGLNSSFRVVRLTEDYEDFEGALNGMAHT